MGLFSKKEITWEDVMEFLAKHKHEITDTVAEDLMKIIVKTSANKIQFYRVEE